MKIKLESIDKEVTLAEAKALFEELKVLEDEFFLKTYRPPVTPIPMTPVWPDPKYLDHYYNPGYCTDKVIC